MAASYPGAIKTFSAITSGVTVLEQALFDEMHLEIEAIEATLGLNVQGSSGSIRERVNLAMDNDGGPPGRLGSVHAADNEATRMRCGINSFTSDSLASRGTGAVSGMGGVTYPTPFPGGSTSIVFCELQLVEADPTVDTNPAFIVPYGAASDLAFSFLVTTRKAARPANGTSFIVHWIAFQATPSYGGTI
jgi:hypothetical protein